MGLPTPNISCQTTTQSLGYIIPETVHLPFDHSILCGNLFCNPLCFPLIKVQDFLNTECVMVFVVCDYFIP